MNVAGTLRVPLPRLGDSERHTECACYIAANGTRSVPATLVEALPPPGGRRAYTR